MQSIIRLILKFAPPGWISAQLEKPSGFLGRSFIGTLLEKGNATLNSFALSHMRAGPACRVLEIGFGPGDTLARLAEQCSEGFVAGIDFSAEMVERARRLNARFIRSGLMEIHEADLARIPFPDTSFDIVYTANTIYFWQNPARDAAEIMRVIKPGGRLIVAFRSAESMAKIPFVDQRFTRYAAADVAKLFGSIGYEDCAHHSTTDPTGIPGLLAIVRK